MRKNFGIYFGRNYSGAGNFGDFSSGADSDNVRFCGQKQNKIFNITQGTGEVEENILSKALKIRTDPKTSEGFFFL